MTICDITQFYSPHSGGVKRYLQEKREYLKLHRPSARHVMIIPGEADREIKEGCGSIFTIRSPLVNRTSRYRMVLRLSKVEQLIVATRPDLIESGDPYQIAWKASATAEALGLPSVAFYHSHFPEAYVRSVVKFLGPTINDFVMDFMQRYVRTLYNRFDCTIVPSAPLCQVLASWGVRNLHPTNLGIDPETFYPDPAAGSAFRSQYDIPQDTFLLLFVGRLAPEKNLGTLVDAFRRLNSTYPGRYF
ncbi:MAG: glycosyltransferase, partial [Verrucomicrobiia bacterium]